MKSNRKVIGRFSAVIFIALFVAHPFLAPRDARSEGGPKPEIAENVKGADCFDLFEADAEGHSPVNAYLLALACSYNYHDNLGVSPAGDIEQFQQKYRELFEPWGIDTFEFIQAEGRMFDTELIVMSASKGDFVI